MTENLLSDSLFIVGAGAHVPYSMPTSADLRGTLKKMYACPGPWALDEKHEEDGLFREKKQLFKIAYQLNIVAKAMRQAKPKITSADPLPLVSPELSNHWFNTFLKSFCESHVTSIDAYLSNILKETDLERRIIFGELGKLTVSYLIAEAERASYLGTRDDDWIHFLINQYIKKSPEIFFRNPPQIITFNYDRILERMIFTHLTEYHRKTSDEARQLVDSLKITHVYGDLGEYFNWDELPNDEKLLSFYSTAISRIKVIGEERTAQASNVLKQEIGQRHENTSNIYFLGYGFDEENNTLLTNSFRTYSWFEGKKLYSTCKGIKRVDVARIERTMRTNRMFNINSAGIPTSETLCTELISTVGPLKIG